MSRTRGRERLVWVLAAAIAAFELSPVQAATVPTPTQVSSNWVGYVVVGPGSTETTASASMRFTHVTGQWVQPRVSCTPGNPASVAIWVGLGGYSETSQELEQTGTSADCDRSGKVTYSAWYELVPANSVNVKSFVIEPGDTIVSAIKVTGRQIVLEVIDRTRRTIFTRRLRTASLDLTSAEWIAEAPSECNNYGLCRQIPLADFDRLRFTSSSATGNGASASIASHRWEAVGLELEPRSHHALGGSHRRTKLGDPGRAGADPSVLSKDGSGFGATWSANTAVGG